ncbi:Transcriptional regulator ure2 [Cytospora paraplurivora]|uniref:glutathione transferase n=1 Tax=Cytospora paraplurivora TaxID=2898453 RepID=A0AAN9YN70_9PEZI
MIVSFNFEEIKQKPFIYINLNGRVPGEYPFKPKWHLHKLELTQIQAIEEPNTDITIWESGAIINYLIEVYDKKHVPRYETLKERHRCNQWLHFQVSGQGPYFGQAGWFTVLHAEKLPSAIERYQNEVGRIHGVLEGWLQEREWLVGDRITYADIAFATWNDRSDAVLQRAPEDKFNGFPRVQAWHERMTSRPSWKKAMETRARLMDEQGLDWNGMPNGINTMAEYETKIKADREEAVAAPQE